jgi:hypothetical protein
MTPLLHERRRSNVLANLVYCVTAADAVDVLVGGELVVEGRRHRRLEVGRVLADLQASSLRLQRAIG